MEEGELLVMMEAWVELVVKEADKMAPMHLVVTEALVDQVVRLEAMAELELLTGAQATTQMEEMEEMVEVTALRAVVVVKGKPNSELLITPELKVTATTGRSTCIQQQ